MEYQLCVAIIMARTLALVHPPNPSGDPWRDRAEQMTRLRDEAMASGETVVAEAAGLLAVRYDRLAKLRRGAH
jgi:hypothetical protein